MAEKMMKIAKAIRNYYKNNVRQVVIFLIILTVFIYSLCKGNVFSISGHLLGLLLYIEVLDLRGEVRSKDGNDNKSAL